MALGTLAPWLSTNPQEWGDLAARGAQLDIERQRLADEAQQRKAADALQRDRFQLESTNAQTAQQAQAAGMALRLAALKQAGLMGQEKLGQGQEKLGQGQERIDQSGQSAADKLAQTGQRNADEATHWGNQDAAAQDRNQTAKDMLALKQKQEEEKILTTMSPEDKANESLLRQKIMTDYKAYQTAATDKDRAAMQTRLDDYMNQRTAIFDKYRNKSAASTLTQGTGTNLPTAPVAPAPSPNLAPDPAASSLSPAGNYSAPQFQAKLPGASKGNPSPDDIAYLRANPNMAAKFDARFGAGLAAQILAQ